MAKNNTQLGKLTKPTIFSMIGIIGVIICITWFNKEKQFDVMEQSRISTYNRLSALIGKIIGVSNADSLQRWNNSFNHDFYDGETIPLDDSMTLLAMRRFKFELNDKLNGTINILDPNKFETIGHDLIQACRLQIFKMTKASKELAKNN